MTKLTGRGAPGRGQGRKPTGRRKYSIYLRPEVIDTGIPCGQIIELAISKLDEE